MICDCYFFITLLNKNLQNQLQPRPHLADCFNLLYVIIRVISKPVTGYAVMLVSRISN